MASAVSAVIYLYAPGTYISKEALGLKWKERFQTIR